MRAVVQRVKYSEVKVDEKVISKIGPGLFVLLGVENEDTIHDAEWLAGKICRLRIFGDEHGLMNQSVLDQDKELMVVSQFTLHASTKKGNRPSFIKAAKPEVAVPLYEEFIKLIQKESKNKVGTGQFGADMKIELINDGPVTIIIDSKNKE